MSQALGITQKESEDLRGMFVHTNPVRIQSYMYVCVYAVI